MKHNLKIIMKINLNGLSETEYEKIQGILYSELINAKSVSFTELDELLFLKNRRFFSTSIEFPHWGYNETKRKITTIEIQG